MTIAIVPSRRNPLFAALVSAALAAPAGATAPADLSEAFTAAHASARDSREGLIRTANSGMYPKRAKPAETADFMKLRERFSQAASPETLSALKMGTTWTCHSLVNNTGGANRIEKDEVAFENVDGRVISGGAPMTLNYGAVEGGLYSSFKRSNRGFFRGADTWIAVVYRAEADGALIRETTLIYDGILNGINSTPSLGAPERKMAGKGVGVTVLSYATCATNP